MMSGAIALQDYRPLYRARKFLLKVEVLWKIMAGRILPLAHWTLRVPTSVKQVQGGSIQPAHFHALANFGRTVCVMTDCSGSRCCMLINTQA